MRQFIMTSELMTGEIKLTYNDEGFIDTLQIEAVLIDKQYLWLFSNFPFSIGHLNDFKSKAKATTIIEKKIEITFDMFWNRYNEKTNSSKKKTEAIWNKMSDANRLKAYLFIKTYDKNRGEVAKKYAETYLRAELWNNNT